LTKGFDLLSRNRFDFRAMDISRTGMFIYDFRPALWNSVCGGPATGGIPQGKIED